MSANYQLTAPNRSTTSVAHHICKHSRPKLIGFGAMNIDHLYRVDKVIVDGEQLVIDYQSFPGGSAANTTYGLSKLGIKTGLVGIVGMDETGQELIQDLKSVGVDTCQIRVKQKAKTGYTICLSDKLGRRAIYVSPEANNLLDSKDIDITYLSQAQIVHLSSLVGDRQFNQQIEVVKKLPDSVKVTLSPGMLYAAKGLQTLAPLLERTYIVFMNHDEIVHLTGKNFKDGAQECLQLGCHMVVVTLGKGISKDKKRIVTGYIRDRVNEYEIESEVEEQEGLSLETTGAGDAFAAGFLFGFLKGKEIRKCGILGDIMAHFAIREPGSRKGLPNLTRLSQSYLKRTREHL